EDGAILLVVLILAVTFSLLGIALTSTVEVSVRARNNADELTRAERAAVSGIEWAAAAVMTTGMVNGGRTVPLDSGAQAGVTTEIANRTVNGVVVVSLDLGLGQRLTIRDAVINGTVVVRGLLPALPLLGLTTPEVRIVGATTINGGTARTGNVALLAPDAVLN